MKLYCFKSELFSSNFVFLVISFNESFNAVNIYVYSDPSLYCASPIAASLLRGIFYSAFFKVNPIHCYIKNIVLQHRSLNYYSYL